MKKWLWIASLLITHHALADEPVLGFDAGTSGLGVHLAYPVQTSVEGRLGANFFTADTSRDVNDMSYDIKLKLRTLDMLLDWYPMEGSFRLTGGLILNGNKFSGTAQADGNLNYTINGNVYNAAQAGVISGSGDYRSVAPYLGIGWDTSHAKQKGWGFNGDIGVMFQGNSNITLTNSGCTLGIVGGVNLCQNLENDLAAERVTLEDKANKLRYFPLLRAGLNYRF